MNGLKMQMDMKRLSMREVAEEIGIHPKTLREWCKNPKGIRHEKIINAINKLDKKRGRIDE
jgi:plasmid maintenance system antidote protein VapI